VFPTDPFSTLSHLAGAVGAALLARPLMRRGAFRCARRSLLVFAGSAVILLLASAAYHAMPEGTGREVFRRLDHAAIFLLIAGTFTPIHTILFRGVMRWGVLAFVWTVGVVGVTLKTVFFDDIPEVLGVGSYVAMGWIGAVTMGCLLRRHDARYVSPLVLGGLAYTAGALSELTGQPTLITGVIEAHEVFHLAVLVGLGSMWLFIWRTAGEQIDPVRAEAERTPAALVEPKPTPRDEVFPATR
jgi:hemolysin III